mmetsp:Transcript_91565/g.294255  ORF Transcript_91565/g.294255 Transcript_91565/m.294255 type:complete len:225 (+) Transcript_91565:250-924(+)
MSNLAHFTDPQIATSTAILGCQQQRGMKQQDKQVRDPQPNICRASVTTSTRRCPNGSYACALPLQSPCAVKAKTAPAQSHSETTDEVTPGQVCNDDCSALSFFVHPNADEDAKDAPTIRSPDNGSSRAYCQATAKSWEAVTGDAAARPRSASLPRNTSRGGNSDSAPCTAASGDPPGEDAAEALPTGAPAVADEEEDPSSAAEPRESLRQRRCPSSCCRCCCLS